VDLEGEDLLLNCDITNKFSCFPLSRKQLNHSEREDNEPKERLSFEENEQFGVILDILELTP
jgi:hypothetical protein